MIAKIGHRGCPVYVAENSMESFAFAFAYGADAVELDVQMSKDGYAVVMHDDVVDRTTDGVGVVADLTLAELNKIQIIDGDERRKIPLLTEVLYEFSGVEGRTVFIEVKHGADAQKVAQLVQEAVKNGGWNYSQLVMISFDVGIVVAVRKVDVHIPLGLTFEDAVANAEILAVLEREKPDYININIKVVSAEFVEEIYQRGARVNVWTVNDAQGVKACVDAKVFGVMSDDIILLNQEIDEDSLCKELQ